jgi:hypothetical protein
MSEEPHGFCVLPEADPGLGYDYVPKPKSGAEAVMDALQLQRELYAHLTDEQFGRLQALLFEFVDIFAVDGASFGCVAPEQQFFHRIDTGDARPVTQKPYKLSYAQAVWLKGELDRLLQLGVIRPSSSPWMSPVVIVPKPNGGFRLCVDMRLLNRCTNPDPYPLPTVDEMHAAMGGCKLWSKMDFVSGFWQVPIHPDDCFKCGLTTPHGNFEFCRMVMGMQSAPATFQRLMDRMLAGVQGAKTYIDDTFTFTSEFEGQLHALRQVFERTREYGLTMNPLKCRFCVEEVVCLGHLVSAQGIRPVFDKLEAVKALPLPQNVKGLRRFLGMMEQYRKYIQGYAAIAAPLHLMLRHSVAFQWSHDALVAFQALKDALCDAPVLALPNWEAPFILTTDWSRVAVGAVLSQVDNATGEEHPNAFASRTLTPAERNYAATEGECLAVKWATEKFFYYLHGRRFKLRTDHSALQWLDSARFTNAKLERWALHLQEFDFEVEYIKGSTNVVADYLSREGAVAVTPEDSDQVEHVPLVSLVISDPVWPEEAAKQAELDAVPCAVCGDPGGFDNMAVCAGCNTCTHLRCVMPPMSTVPSGDWYCPGCDLMFSNFDELRDPEPILQYAANDPYCDNLLVSYVLAGHDESLLASLPVRQARALRHRAWSLRPHPRVSGWLQVASHNKAGEVVWRTCPPLHYRWDLMRCMHDALGHAGVRRLAAGLQPYFYWRGVSNDVRLFVAQCDSCQRRKLAMPAPIPMQEPVVRGPFEHVHIDLCGPFDTPVVDLHGKLFMPETPVKAYVVLMIDYFTKAAEFSIIYDKKPASVAKAFYYAWICRYFVPGWVTSDNGTEFETEFVHLLARLGIQHVHTSACHPAANGVVERLVGSFKSILLKHINDHPVHWLQSVPVVRQQYWARLHSALGMSPFEMVFGRQPVPVIPQAKLLLSAVRAGVSLVPDSSPEDAECQAPFEYVQQLRERMLAVDRAIFDQIRQQFQHNAAAWPLRGAGLKARSQPKLKVGDLVLEVVSGPVAALDKAVLGPFKVVEIRDSGVVVLSTGDTAFKNAVLFKRHITNLARYLDKSSVRAALCSG